MFCCQQAITRFQGLVSILLEGQRALDLLMRFDMLDDSAALSEMSPKCPRKGAARATVLWKAYLRSTSFSGETPSSLDLAAGAVEVPTSVELAVGAVEAPSLLELAAGAVEAPSPL